MPHPLASAPNINHLWAGLLVEELVRQGTTFFVVCPGSRSTPLAVAVAQNPRAEALVHWDERAAAFVALGWGRATGRPAAVVTTSGTAVANLFPAAVEADADGVPLLLLTADRPPELRETGANQTVRQPPVFQDVARWALDWPVPTVDVPARWVLSTAAHAVARAVDPPGPVHLNLPFREPLAATPDGTDAAAYLGGLGDWFCRELGPNESYTMREVEAGRVDLVREDEELVSVIRRDPFAASRRPRPDHRGRSDKQRRGEVETDILHLFDRLWSVERGVVVLGAVPGGDTDPLMTAMDAHEVALGLGWPLLPDVRSPLRVGDGDFPPLIPHVDLILASSSFRKGFVPDAVLHVGGRIVSKRLARFLAESRPPMYVHLHGAQGRVDPDSLVTDAVRAPLDHVLASITSEVSWGDRRRGVGQNWVQSWTSASQAVSGALDEHLNQLSEPAVARRVIGTSSVVVAAASMPIRDVEAFAPAGHEAPRVVVANRGASGIDGTVATAAGYARGIGGTVATLVGDLALLHDQTSLALLRNGPPVVVVVVNNDGGGIFHRLPIADGPGELAADTFERFFGTPHGLTFEHAAAQVGLAYHAPETVEAFEAALETARQSGASALIEVRTDRQEQAALRRRIEAACAEAVDAVLAGEAEV